jgi:hypothetical protein
MDIKIGEKYKLGRWKQIKDLKRGDKVASV